MLLLCALIVGSGSAWAQSLSIDFEKETTDYTDWVFENMTSKQTNSNVTAHGGSYFGTTGGKATASVTTKNKIASPKSIQFYVSKQSTNTTASSWKVETSSDKETWNQVGDAQSATSMTKGNWVEVKRDLSSLSDVYVRISYGSNTAIRCIDDVTLSYEDASKTNVTLSFPQASYSADIAEGANSFSAPTASSTPSVTGITYSSTTPAVATVDENTGVVTLVKKGETTIKASFAGDDTYNSAEASYTLTITNSNANDGSEAKPFTVDEAIDFIKATEYGDGNYYVKGIISKISSTSVLSGGYLTYYISDDGTEINQLQVYKGKNKGDAEFTAVEDIAVGDNVIIVGPLLYYSNSTPEINTGNYIYSTDHTTLTVPELVVEDIAMEVSQTKSVEDLYLTDSDGEVTVTSSSETVAKVEGGVLTAVGKGEATITVSIAKTAAYYATSKTFKVTVTVKDAVQPEGATAASYFEKVTSTADLVDGQYLIVYAGDDKHASVAFNGALEKLDAANNGIAVTITDNKIIADDNLKAAVFTWNSTAKTLTSTNSIAIGNDSYSNGLKSDASGLTNTITFDESGNAVISAVESASSENYTTLRYNYASDNLRFRYYKSGQQAIQLYLLKESAANSFDITVSDAGWRTLVSAQDVTLPEGLTAYVVTNTDDNKATLQEVSSIKANNPYILNGAKGTYTLTVADGVEAPAANLLQISTESTGNGVYVLAQPDGKEVGFYKWNGGSLGAGRVYLPAPSAGAPEFLGFVFDGETTGVKAIENGRLAIDNAVYNLAGQRVANPTKGLYIVNGKKVIIK